MPAHSAAPAPIGGAPGRQEATPRGQLKDITLIAERPVEVDDRREFGHWEGDLVLGTNNSAIATLVERTTRYTEIVKLAGHKSPVVIDAVSTHMQQMRPAALSVLVTLTWDRGKEKRIASLSDYSQHDYDQVAAELNDRPRKILDYRTPAEAMDDLAPPRPSDAVLMSAADVKRAGP